MARTTRRRRRKHRGTQSGSIDRRGRTRRPRSRQEARARARQQLGQKRERHEAPPTWRSGLGRGFFAAGMFLLLLLVLFHRPFASSLAISVIMLAVYIPMGYAIERFMYNRRQAAARRERERRARSE